eukprot:gene17559-19311_t
MGVTSQNIRELPRKCWKMCKSDEGQRRRIRETEEGDIVRSKQREEHKSDAGSRHSFGGLVDTKEPHVTDIGLDCKWECQPAMPSSRHVRGRTMEFATRSRQRKQKMNETSSSKRPSRSSTRQQRGKAGEFQETTLRRSSRGKVDAELSTKSRLRRERARTRGGLVQTSGSRREQVITTKKRAIKKRQTQKGDADSIAAVGSQQDGSVVEMEDVRFASNVCDSSSSNDIVDCGVDIDKSSNQDSSTVLNKIFYSQVTESNSTEGDDNNCRRRSLGRGTDVFASDKMECDSPSSVRSDNDDDKDESIEGASQRSKRRRKRRRYHSKKKQTRIGEQDDKDDKDEDVSESPVVSLEEDGRGMESSKSEHAEKDDDYKPKCKRNRLGMSMVSKLETSKGFVDKIKFGVRPEEIVPMKRTPRMASLNAIAKVNAVLESFSPLAGKPTGHRLKESDGNTKKSNASKSRKRSTSSVTQTDDIPNFPPLRDIRDDWVVSSATANDVFNTVSPDCFDDQQPISDSRVSSTSNCISDDERAMIATRDKAVQTIVNHKAVQTDSYLMQDRSSEVSIGNLSGCTCNSLDNTSASTVGKTASTGTTCYKMPTNVPGGTLSVPLRSSILTKTTTHSIAIPFTKTHVLSHMDMGGLDKLTGSFSSSNAQTNKRMASLNAIAMMNAMKVLDKPFLSIANFPSTGNSKRHEVDKSERNGGAGHIRIPKITFQATSTSKFGGNAKGKIFNPTKSSQLKSISSQIERLMENKRPDVKPSSKMVNGWLFEGEAFEKPIVYDDKVVIRRYYTCMRRNAEVINVRDAVLLKSGPRKKDLPFVARVAAIWEEDGEFSSGDMMISVFWYYRPEQTDVGKISGYNGDLEVLASRHRDDNSAACVVDKCYVLNYPQYCRFRARNKLFRESRRVPLSPVPPSESTRPGLMPPANTDPNLVFFCRHAYDSRTGKIIKNPFY